MDFCPIVPTSMLQRYLEKRKTWFALAHVADVRYTNFYCGKPDDVTLILDNGTYEGRMVLYDYDRKIQLYKPTVAVLPDIYLGDSDRSLHLSLGFLEQCGLSSHTYTNEWMFVPQARPDDMDGFISATAIALKDERVTWVGIPRCLATDISDNPLARVHFAQAVKKDYPHIKLHALGMVKGNIHELYYLQKVGVRSCDSAAPVWRGAHGFNLHTPEWHERPIDFSSEGCNYRMAEENLEAIDQCLNTP